MIIASIELEIYNMPKVQYRHAIDPSFPTNPTIPFHFLYVVFT